MIKLAAFYPTIRFQKYLQNSLYQSFYGYKLKQDYRVIRHIFENIQKALEEHRREHQKLAYERFGKKYFELKTALRDA